MLDVNSWSLDTTGCEMTVIDNCADNVFTYPNYCFPNYVYYPYSKSAKEQVLDEILLKVADALKKNNIKKAKELVELTDKLRKV